MKKLVSLVLLVTLSAFSFGCTGGTGTKETPPAAGGGAAEEPPSPAPEGDDGATNE